MAIGFLLGRGNTNKDDDWDDLEDLNMRGGNRMSGIVKTNTNDEQMFGTTKFDDV